MARLVFTQENLPSPEEFKRILLQETVRSNPVEDLLESANRLWEYEQKYGMSSAEFYAQFQEGILDDELQHCMGWVFAFKTFTELKCIVETALMWEAVERESLTEPAGLEPDLVMS